jgi:hypothetical protein
MLLKPTSKVAGVYVKNLPRASEQLGRNRTSAPALITFLFLKSLLQGIDTNYQKRKENKRNKESRIHNACGARSWGCRDITVQHVSACASMCQHVSAKGEQCPIRKTGLEERTKLPRGDSTPECQLGFHPEKQCGQTRTPHFYTKKTTTNLSRPMPAL